jgi:hypothetical protein
MLKMPPNFSGAPVSRIYYIAIAALVLLFLCHLALFFKFTVDDAYITFAYSRNLALGEGLRIAVGNPVEANSSLLWSVILAPGIWFGLDLGLFSGILGALSAFGSVFFVFILTKKWNAEPENNITSFQLALIASFLTIANSSFSLWSVYGMENGFVSVLILASLYQFYNEVENKAGLSSALLIAALYMTRPEAFGYVFVYIVARFVYSFIYKDATKQWFYSWFGLLITLIIAYEVWGFYYYGYLLPTSAVAKVGTSLLTRFENGFFYTLFGGHASLLTVIGMLFLLVRVPKLVSSFSKHKQANFRTALLASLLLMHTAFIVAAGGDWMPNFRFWSQAVPLGAVLFVTEMSHFAFFKKTSVIVVSLCLYVGLQLYADKHFLEKVEELDNAQQQALKGMADFLNTRYQPGDVVAASDIGLLTYHFKGTVLDWWGLADEKIGRSDEAAGRITPETILERKPNYIVLYSNKPMLMPEESYSGMAKYSASFITHPEFTRQYKQITQKKFWDKRYHILFARQ